MSKASTQSDRVVGESKDALGGAWALLVFYLVASACLYGFWVRDLDVGAGGGFLPWWPIALGFLLTEGVVIDLPFRHDSYPFSLSEIPLMVGLFFLSPPELLLASLAGVFGGLALVRGQRGLKLAFNMSVQVLEMNVAYLIFAVIAHTADPLDRRSWIAAFAASVGVCFISNASVTAVLSSIESRWQPTEFLRDLILAVFTGTTNTCLAIIGVALVEIDPFGLVLLVVPCAVLLFAYYNIIQRHRAETELHRRELGFRALVQNSADAVGVMDERGVLTFVTPSIERVIGVSPEDVIGTDAFELLSPADRERAKEASEGALTEPDAVAYFIARAPARDGSVRWVEATLHNLVHDPNVGGIVANMRDVTARHLAEEEVRESEERLQSILDHSHAAVFIKDLQGRYQLVNKRLEEINGRVKYDIIGRTDQQLWPSEIADRLHENDRRVIESLTPLSVEEALVDATGPRVFLTIKFPMFDAAGGLTGVCGISTDITESKRIEEQLVQSEKMQAVGQLAGGIAHDFNNLLAIIQNYAQFIIEELPENDPIRDDAEEIVKAGKTAASLTRQLLAFSRKDVYRPQHVDLNAVVQSTCNMLRPGIPATVQLNLDLDHHLKNVLVDTGRMEQVIMNLAINARDAMDGGGNLTIRTRNEIAPDGSAEHVVLSVEDTGGGIPADVLPHIFEPFFTTKSREQGTGLGLASVYGIVEDSGGRIDVDSVVGRGTTFSIRLPVCDGVSVEDSGASLAPSGNGHLILIAEDERGVRNIAERILSAHGYKVLTAAAGREACTLWERHGSDIDLLLADVIMPDMSGRELSERTGLNTVFMSGYTDQIIDAEGLQSGGVAFLPKPFTAEALLTKIAEAIGRVRTSA